MGTLQSSFEKVRQIKQKHIPLHLYGQSWESAHPGVRATAAWHERQDALDRLQRQRQLDQLDALNLRTRQPQLPPPPPLPPAPAGAQVGKPRVAKCSTVSKIWPLSGQALVRPQEGGSAARLAYLPPPLC